MHCVQCTLGQQCTANHVWYIKHANDRWLCFLTRMWGKVLVVIHYTVSINFRQIRKDRSCSVSWRRHHMNTFSALLAICAGNSPVPGDFPAQRPVMRSFDVFFDLRLNKWLSKHSWGWWFEKLSCTLWRHCNVFTPYVIDFPLIWRIMFARFKTLSYVVRIRILHF